MTEEQKQGALIVLRLLIKQAPFHAFALTFLIWCTGLITVPWANQYQPSTQNDLYAPGRWLVFVSYFIAYANFYIWKVKRGK
jgi:hypothetical protein